MSGKEMRVLIESIIIEDHNDAHRLSEIKDQIKELMEEARSILEQGNERVWFRAKSYWYAHIITALDKDHMYLGGSMTTMQDTIDELGSGTMEDLIGQVNDLMNDGAPLEDAVNKVAQEADINPNELMAAAQQALT